MTAPVERRTALDRFLAAIPYALALLVLLSILMWQAAVRKTPTIFTDELEWAQLSRSIAHTGHAARRGQEISFKSLYAFLIAPGWWFATPSAGYATVKYIGTIVMSLACVPVFLLARLLVSTRAAAVVAAATLATSAYFYAAVLVPEVLAYPTFALCAYVSVRALSGDGRRWTIAAIALSLVAIEVRSELVAAGGALAIAAAALWLCGPRGKRLTADWGRRDYVGAVTVAIAALVAGNELASSHAYEWSYTTAHWKGRIWTLGLEAGSAFAIGLGLLPVIAGLASLWLPERRADPRWRAFAAFTAASIVTFGTYTAVKAAYLSTNFATRVEERNLIYLGPLLLVGTAVYFASRRPWLPAVLVTTAATGWIVLHYGYQLDYPYFEAPGYGVAVMANRSFAWTQHDIRIALAVALAVALAFALVPFVRRITEQRRLAVLSLGAAALMAWLLAGEITSARGLQARARIDAASLPQPLDWVDRLTHRRGTTYLSQAVGVNEGVWLLEFWNPSIKHVYSLDGTAPGPGPTLTPDLISPDGSLSNDPGLRYALADNGVQLIGTVLYQRGDLMLTELPSHPWRLREAVYGRQSDGWIGHDASFAYFGPERRSGTLEVDVARAGFCAATAPPTFVTVRVGPVALSEERQPVVRRELARRTFLLKSCRTVPLHFSATPPVAVEIHVEKLVKLSDYGYTDNRTVGATVGFNFTQTP